MRKKDVKTLLVAFSNLYMQHAYITLSGMHANVQMWVWDRIAFPAVANSVCTYVQNDMLCIIRRNQYILHSVSRLLVITELRLYNKSAP